MSKAETSVQTIDTPDHGSSKKNSVWPWGPDSAALGLLNSVCKDFWCFIDQCGHTIHAMEKNRSRES